MPHRFTAKNGSAFSVVARRNHHQSSSEHDHRHHHHHHRDHPKVKKQVRVKVLFRARRKSSAHPNYANLEFVGIYGTTSPFNRIRVWKKGESIRSGSVSSNGSSSDSDASHILYDCTCNVRKPLPSLRNVKRHAYRHRVRHYICPLCGLKFDRHWSLNAHQRAHRAARSNVDNGSS